MARPLFTGYGPGPEQREALRRLASKQGCGAAPPAGPHVEAELKEAVGVRLCKFWESGHCTKGAACAFAHDREPGHATETPARDALNCSHTFVSS